MTFTSVKEKLHEYIDHADEKKVQAIFTLVESEIGDDEIIFDDEIMAMLNERHDSYLSGRAKTYTIEESMENIRKHREPK